MRTEYTKNAYICSLHNAQHTQYIHTPYILTNKCNNETFPVVSISFNCKYDGIHTTTSSTFHFVCTVNWPINVYLHNSLATNYKHVLTTHAKTGGKYNMQTLKNQQLCTTSLLFCWPKRKFTCTAVFNLSTTVENKCEQKYRNSHRDRIEWIAIEK